MNKKVIPYGRQWVSPQDVSAVVRVLRSDRLTQGPEIERFEEAFARAVGAPYAVAVSSGTAALHLAALAAGFGPGDEVITSPYTFEASANCVLYAGARPRFVDIEDNYLGLDPVLAKAAVGFKTKGIVKVDFAGHPSVIGGKENYTRKADFMIINDACHALGAEKLEKGRWVKTGACSSGEAMEVFSFHPVKHITTGEGGMVTTRRRDLWEKIRLLRSHGIQKDPRKFSDPAGKKKTWHYEMTDLGFNYRITDIQCALGFSQLKRIGAIVRKRRQIAAFYTKNLKNCFFLRVPLESEAVRSSWHLYVLRFDFRSLSAPREVMMENLRKRGVATQVHYIPVTGQPYYQKRFGYKKGDFPIAETAYQEALSIPIYPTMTLSDTQKVVREIKKVCGALCR